MYSLKKQYKYFHIFNFEILTLGDVVTVAVLAVVTGECRYWKFDPRTLADLIPAGPKPLPPGEIDLQHAPLAPCSYSLFDLKHGKYVVADWSLPRLVTEAKVKKWCERPGDYIVLHSPHAHCGRYYKDLCHVSYRTPVVKRIYARERPFGDS